MLELRIQGTAPSVLKCEGTVAAARITKRKIAFFHLRSENDQGAVHVRDTMAALIAQATKESFKVNVRGQETGGQMWWTTNGSGLLTSVRGRVFFDRRSDLPVIGRGRDEVPVLQQVDDALRSSTHFWLFDLEAMSDSDLNPNRPAGGLLVAEYAHTGPKHHDIVEYTSVLQPNVIHAHTPILAEGALERLAANPSFKKLRVFVGAQDTRDTYLRPGGAAELDITVKPRRGGHLDATEGWVDAISAKAGLRASVTFDDGTSVPLFEDEFSVRLDNVPLDGNTRAVVTQRILHLMLETTRAQRERIARALGRDPSAAG